MKRKTRIERVYNEDTGWFETREVELNSYSFTDDDRIMIVREYMESGLPAEEIIKSSYWRKERERQPNTTHGMVGLSLRNSFSSSNPLVYIS
jgi:hypothetical protein